MERKAVIVVIMILALLVGCDSRLVNKKQDNKTEYMVLVGEDSTIVNRISDVDVLVIDAAYFSSEDIAQLKSNNVGKIYSYLNVGSIENFRSFYDDYDIYTLGDYENWPEEKWIDVSQPAWIDYVLSEGVELAGKGVDGFFIDNADVYYLFPDDTIYDGLVSILEGLKALDKTVIINGGDSFVSAYIESGADQVIFDGVNQESVYTRYDFDNESFVKNSEEDKQYYTEYLDMLVENGYVVYITEYATDSDITNEANAFSGDHNYVCYVSDNIELLLSD